MYVTLPGPVAEAMEPRGACAGQATVQVCAGCLAPTVCGSSSRRCVLNI